MQCGGGKFVNIALPISNPARIASQVRVYLLLLVSELHDLKYRSNSFTYRSLRSYSRRLPQPFPEQ